MFIIMSARLMTAALQRIQLFTREQQLFLRLICLNEDIFDASTYREIEINSGYTKCCL